MMPFENNSTMPGLDWIGEAFPEVLSTRLKSESLYLIERDDRLNALDRLGIPATAKPSRATVYQVAQELDADYVLIGNYKFDGTTLTAHARIMDVPRLRLGPELTESGALANLVTMQTALAWDMLNALKLSGDLSKDQFVAQFPAVRLDALENYVRGVLAGNAPEKIKRFQETLRLEPKDTLAMLQLGKAYYAARNYNEAVNIFSKVPPGDSSANEAQFFLGLSAFYADQMSRRVVDRGAPAHISKRACTPIPAILIITSIWPLSFIAKGTHNRRRVSSRLRWPCRATPKPGHFSTLSPQARKSNACRWSGSSATMTNQAFARYRWRSPTPMKPAYAKPLRLNIPPSMSSADRTCWLKA